jgi:uncharacterized protein YfeS
MEDMPDWTYWGTGLELDVKDHDQTVVPARLSAESNSTIDGSSILSSLAFGQIQNVGLIVRS